MPLRAMGGLLLRDLMVVIVPLFTLQDNIT
jgi:hypothetical protein